MNKVVALSLVSVFLLSILVGYIPVMTTQAAAGGTQTYIVQIKPPYIFAVVITNVNLGTPQTSNTIGTYLNETLNATQVTVSIINVQTGQTVNSFTGNVNVSRYDKGQVDAYYSPAAQAILMVFDLAATSPTTFSMGALINYVYGAIGVNLINSTYPCLIDIYGNKVFSNQSATLITANAITDGTLAQWSGYETFTNPVALQANNEEAEVAVAPTKVYSATNPAGAPAPTASAVLFAPMSIVNIYNPMMGGQPVGWGRSLINITVYNPLQSSTGWYLYQLNYTGPGPITIYFYPAIQVYSADQLANLKPEVGLFSFNGSGTGINAFNYTLLVMTMSPTVFAEVYYNGGKVGYGFNGVPGGNLLPPSGGSFLSYYNNNNGLSTDLNNLVFMVAFTFSPTNFNHQYIWRAGTITVTANGVTVNVPLYAVYVNSSVYALQLGSNNDPLVWFGKHYAVNLTVAYKLLLKPFPVSTQLSTSSYEMFQGSSYRIVTGTMNEYTGMLFTTPPGNQTVVGTYTLTGNITMGTQYTNVYVTGFSTFYFENLYTNPTNSPEGRAYYYSVEGVIGTPAYPYLNGSTFYGINVEANTYYANGYYYAFVSTATLSATYSGATNNLVQMTLSGNFAPNTLVFGQVVSANNVPAYQVISPAAEKLTLPLTPTLFYQALVNLGLWGNNTVVYVTGYYYYPTQMKWYQMYGTSYFMAVVIPPTVTVANVTPRDLVCSNAIWVNFRSPDDVLVTGYYSGTYGMTLPQGIYNVSPANGPTLINVQAVVFLPLPELAATNVPLPINNTLHNANDGFFNITVNKAPVPITAAVSQLATKIMQGQYVSVSGPLQYLISNYPGVSNFTAQSGVPGGLNISVSLPNGLPVNWTTKNGLTPPEVGGIVKVSGVEYLASGRNNVQVKYVSVYNFTVAVPYVLPQYNTLTYVPTPNFNVTVYVRYQLYDSTQFINAQSITVSPGIYYGPQNSIIVITPPNLTVGTKLTLYFVSGDYAVHHYFTKNYWNKTVTITVPNATLTLRAPSVVPLYQLSVPLQLIEPYYAAPYPAQLQIGTNTVTLLANTYNFFGVTPKPLAVGVGKFVDVTIRFANGTTERIYLTGDNVTTLFEGGTLNENGSCTGAYNATISVQGLMTILHLTTVSQLNGSCLSITYYDNITHEIATAKICFGAVSVVSPITITPAYVFYVLTAKYVNATFGYPVTLAQSVAVQPFVSLNDTFLAKAQAGVVADLYVTNVTIVDHYGNRYVIYYNSTNGSTNVMVNGVVKYAFKGYLLPTIPETAPNTGIFNGTPITFVINMPGMIYKNGTVFNGTLAVKLGSNVVTLGPATNFALPAFSFAGKLFGYNSTMYVKVEDPVSGSTVTLRTYIAAYNITPIRIAPVTIPVPMPANASIKLQYVDNQPITLTPTNQYIVIHVTSIINYTYVFYIATVVQPGKNATTTPPVLVNFQTVVPVPVIGPGIVAQVPVQFSQIGALGSGYYTITMFAVPFAGGPVISLYPAKLVFTNVYVNTTVV